MVHRYMLLSSCRSCLAVGVKPQCTFLWRSSVPPEDLHFGHPQSLNSWHVKFVDIMKYIRSVCWNEWMFQWAMHTWEKILELSGGTLLGVSARNTKLLVCTAVKSSNLTKKWLELEHKMVWKQVRPRADCRCYLIRTREREAERRLLHTECQRMSWTVPDATEAAFPGLLLYTELFHGCSLQNSLHTPVCHLQLQGLQRDTEPCRVSHLPYVQVRHRWFCCSASVATSSWQGFMFD